MGSETTDGKGRSEADRLAALDSYRILDTPAEAGFDDIVRIAATICGMPVALITLIDDRRQWFKAAVGTDITETPREIAFCTHAIGQQETMIVPDMRDDPRFAANPLVTGETAVRFYAGAQLRTSEGLALGTLCVLDQQPGALTLAQQDALAALARQVMVQLDLRRLVARQRDAEERQRLILESAVDYAIVSMDLAGRVTSWNEGARRILGWTGDEMCGHPCDRFFTPEDRAAGIPGQEMGKALTGGRSPDERWHLRRNGERFWGFGEMMPLTDEDGRAVGFLKIFRDLTEQHQAEERIKAGEARFQLALDAAGFIGSWDWDIPADRVYADEHFAGFYSVPAEDAAAGLPFAASIAGIHPEDREWVGERIAQAVATCGEFAEEYRLRQAGGRVVWVAARGRCLCDEAGTPTHFPGVAVEITERRAMEDTLRLSETRTRLALEAADMGAWEVTPDLDLGEQQWDPRTRLLLGHGPDEPVTFASFVERVHADDRPRVRQAVVDAVTLPGAVIDTEFRVVTGQDSQHWVHVRGRLIAAPDQARRLVGTVRDVTAQKNAEERGALLAHELQHRIKNTLAVVQAIVAQSLRNVATPAEAGEAIGNRLATLGRAHDLLTQNSWTAAPIHAVIEGATRIHSAHDERIRLAGPAVLLQAKSALAMAMAIHELSTNAAKYGALSNDVGTVDVTWREEGPAGDVTLVLVWHERDGPAVTPPTHSGFGSRLMRGLSRDLGGPATADYAPGGLVWSLRARLDDIREITAAPK